MKKDTQKKLWADWFNISGHWYTCEEYDLSGHYMRYTSITARKHIDINTTDSRYTPSWLTTMTATEYLIDYLRVENVNDALARAMEFGIDWAEQSGHPAEDCLRYGNTNAMVYAVTTGRISAWIVYNCESGQKFLSELDQTQIAMVWPYIDSDVWMKKFADYVADQEYVREMLQKAGCNERRY